jgi:hypothetical protein
MNHKFAGLVLTLVLGGVAETFDWSRTQQAQGPRIDHPAPQALKAKGTSDDAKSGQFCSDLNAIIQASETKFESIRGKPDPGTDGQGYVSKVRVQGSEGCTVWFPDSWVSCSLGTYPDSDHLAYPYEDFAAKVHGCLSGWPVTPEDASSRRLKGMKFLGPQGVIASIEVFSKTSLRFPGYLLILSVSREPIDEK